MIKKFPVTSKNGNEYLVKIYESYLFETSYEVRVYEQYTGWFGRVKYRFINESFMNSARYYNIEEFDFDLVEMAKHEITRMEAEWEAYSQLQQKKQEAKQKFEEWNGDCQ